MRLVRNNGYLKGRRRAARTMFWGGLLSFVVSFPVLYLLPQYWILAYVVLIAAIILFNGGMQQMTKWSRHPRPDEILDQKLRRLSDRYTLIHFPTIPDARSAPEHVLVFPGGLLVITTRELAGGVHVENNRWKRTTGRFLAVLTFGGPSLGNPTTECNAQQEALRAFLTERDLPGEDAIDGMIAFLNPRIELEVIASDLTVVKLDEIASAVRDLGTEAVLHTKARDEIIAALASGEDVEGPVSLPSREPSAKGTRAGR